MTRSANRDRNVILKLTGSKSHTLDQPFRYRIELAGRGDFSNASGVSILEQTIGRDQKCSAERAKTERNGNCGAASDERLPDLPTSEIEVRRCIDDPGTRIADTGAGDSAVVYDDDDGGRLAA